MIGQATMQHNKQINLCWDMSIHKELSEELLSVIGPKVGIVVEWAPVFFGLAHCCCDTREHFISHVW